MLRMVASRALAALALALAAGAAASQHVCDPGAPGGCTVCEECCHIVGDQSRCDACVASPLGCAFDCANSTEACSRQCVQHCWSEVTSAPCIRDCVSCHGLWLLLGVCTSTPCQGDASTFNAGHGGCDSYAPGAGVG